MSEHSARNAVTLQREPYVVDMLGRRRSKARKQIVSLEQPILVFTVAVIGQDLNRRRPGQSTQQQCKRIDIPGLIVAAED